MWPRQNRLFSTTSKSTTIANENILRMVINLPLISSWNGGIIKKRLNNNSTFMWQDQSNLYFVKGVNKRKMIMNYIQKVLTVFFVIGFISICVTHQSIAESNFQEIISKDEQGEADAQYHLGSMYYSGEG